MPTQPATPAAPLPRLRRVALAAQGLHRNAPFGRGKNAVLRAIEHIGYVQIDTISVVERAHHHVLRSRVPNYTPAMLHRLVSERSVFEYWYHAAAYLPMRDYRFCLPEMAAFRDGTARWMRSSDTRLVEECIERIRIDGPLKSRDFDDPRSKSGAWWDWKPAKRALEQAFMQGDLMVIERDGFQKTYDLTERALPSDVDTSMPSEQEFARHLVDTTLRAHGVAHLKSFSHLRRGQSLRRAIQQALEEDIAAGRVEMLHTTDGQRCYALSEYLQARTPAIARKHTKILSPFDNAVILRDRTRAFYDFDYTIECYVPAAKRRWGYFCLPILMGDAFLGRLDAKAHRAQRRLALKHLHVEQPLDEAQRQALVCAIVDFARFNGCDEIHLENITPKQERTPVNALLRSYTP